MPYMEVMATLEEDFSDLKSIQTHKLFCRKPRANATQRESGLADAPP